MNTLQTKRLDPNAKLGMVERVAYGLGDFSANLVYSTISAFLLIYYTNVLGMPALVCSSVMAISKIFDGISDLIMGRIVDKTKSKYGKARPWILRMCVPLAVCNVLLYSVPASLAGSAQIAYVFLSYNLVSTVFYTAVNVPYSTLQGLMTTNQYERGLLGNFRMLLATAGTMTVNTVVIKLCTFFGDGDPYTQKGWTLAVAVLMVAFVILNFITFFFCKERVTDEVSSTQGDKGPSVLTCFKSLVTNKYWVIMVVFLFCLYFMMSTFYGGAAYYAQYVLGDLDLYITISNPLSTAQVVMMFLTPFLMKKIGKRCTALVGMVTATAAFVLTALAGTNVTMVVLCNVLKGAAFGCGAAVMFGLLQDAITYGTWLTGVQAMGMGNAASSFCMKVGSGLGTAALGWILSAGNFDIDPTGDASLAAITFGYVWVPAIACGIAIVCMVLFDLDKHYDKAVADLTAGRWKGSK